MATRSMSKSSAAKRPACLCGCGGFPKSPKSVHLPGHDAKHHSAQKKAKLEKAAARRSTRQTTKAAA